MLHSDSPFRFAQFLDVTPPQIICPDNVHVGTDPDRDSTEVKWNVPIALDNSGYLPTVSVIPALVPPASLPIGNTTIYYTAEDTSKNKAKCSFSVSVKGNVEINKGVFNGILVQLIHLFL